MKLEKEVSALREIVLQHSKVLEETGKESVSYASATARGTVPSHISASAPPTSPGKSRSDSHSQGADRKFNVIIYGIAECPSGTQKATRQSRDLEVVLDALLLANCGVTEQSIRDNFRLGKFAKDRPRPRPILMKFTRSADALCVLSKAKDLRPTTPVRADLSPAQRHREGILLKVRWSLISSGIERAAIKFRNSAIYVDNKLHGRLNIENVFEATSQSEHKSEVQSSMSVRDQTPTPTDASVSVLRSTETISDQPPSHSDASESGTACTHPPHYSVNHVLTDDGTGTLHPTQSGVTADTDPGFNLRLSVGPDQEAQHLKVQPDNNQSSTQSDPPQAKSD